MFKLQDHAEYDWPVEIHQPTDGGEKLVAKCTIRFRAASQDDQDAYSDRRISETEFARKIIVGWGKDVADEEGVSLEFNDENRDRLLKVPYVRGSIVMTYLKSVSGLAQAKNSGTPRGSGS
jgi:acyl-coenzyme A thioesterase PaaI-like protein